MSASTIILPLVGFFVGLIFISLGGGGGSVYVGILTALFGVSPAVASTTSLATIIPTVAVGSYSHWKAGNVNLRYGVTMLIGGVVGAIGGSLFSTLLPRQVFMDITIGLLLLMATLMLRSYLRELRHRGDEQPARPADTRPAGLTTALAIGYGVLGGAMSGLVGLSGGGPIIAGLTLLGCSALETVGTSVFVILGIAVAGFLAHLSVGSVDWKLVGLLALGTTAGALVGPLLLKRIPKVTAERLLRPLLIALIYAMSIILIFK